VFCLEKARSRDSERETHSLCNARAVLYIVYFMPCTQWRVVHDKKGIITRTAMFLRRREEEKVEKRRARHKALSKNPRRTQRNKEEGWMRWKRRFHPRRAPKQINTIQWDERARFVCARRIMRRAQTCSKSSRNKRWWIFG
jgi:hypothetical protein